MLQPKLKLPAIFSAPVLVLFITLFTPSLATLVTVVLLAGPVAYILSNSAVYFSRSSSTPNDLLNELARPFYDVIRFISPLRLNTRNEEVGPDASRYDKQCLPGLLLVLPNAVMERSFLEE
ncbi:MAG TPA: hypothetical protein VGM41_00410 [Chitinophagaceae bacterium]